MHFEKQRQRKDETIDKFLKDLEMLRRHCQPDDSNSSLNLALELNFIKEVKNNELRTTVTMDQNGQKSMAEKNFCL